MSNSVIATKHNGAQIIYCEATNRWQAFIDGAQVACRASLKDARSAVDALHRAESKPAFTRHTALISKAWGSGVSNGVEVVEVTSYVYDEKGKPTDEAWIFRKNAGRFSKTREKVCLSRLYEDTPDNRAINEEIDRLKAQKYALEKRCTDASKQFEQYTKRS